MELALPKDLLLAFFVPVFSRRATRSVVQHPKFYIFDPGVFYYLRPRGPLDKPEEMAEGLLKIIILNQERKTLVSSRNKCPNLKKRLTQIRRKNIFQAMNNPVEWQREIRNEWS